MPANQYAYTPHEVQSSSLTSQQQLRRQRFPHPPLCSPLQYPSRQQYYMPPTPQQPRLQSPHYNHSHTTLAERHHSNYACIQLRGMGGNRKTHTRAGDQWGHKALEGGFAEGIETFRMIGLQSIV